MEVSLETEQYWSGLQARLPEDAVLVIDSGQAPWGQVMLTQDQVVFADEPLALLGKNTGPAPTELVLMALGACTSITVRMYAVRKEWTIDRIAVRLHWEAAEAAGGEFKAISRVIEIDGPLDTEQRTRLLEIADKCPVHKVLSGGVRVRSELSA